MVRFETNPSTIAVEVGPDGLRVYDTTGATKTIEGRVSTALYFNTVGVESIKRNIGEEIITGEVG